MVKAKQLLSAGQTKLCQHCNDGEFYESVMKKCISCESNCDSLCGYRSQCFTCPTGQVYDLTTRKCKAACGSDQVKLSGDQFHGYVFCRDMDYYIDQSSQSPIELGTKDFPYKNLNLPFIEIFNYMSNLNKTITLNVREKTVTVLKHDLAKVVGVHLIHIKPYSVTSGITPSKATIFLTEDDIPVLSPFSAFIALKTATLNFKEKVDSKVILPNEVATMQQNFDSIALLRTSLRIEHFYIRGNYKRELVFSTYQFIRPILLQNRSVWVSDCEFYQQIQVLFSSDPLNLFVKNIYIDNNICRGGFQYLVNCNYPEAFKSNQVLFDNATIESAHTRKIRTRSLLVDGHGTENFTIINSKIRTHSTLSTMISGISRVTNPGRCNPDDGAVQETRLTNNYFTMPFGGNGDRYNDFFQVIAGYSRKYNVIVEGNHFDQVDRNWFSLVAIIAYANANCYIQNNLGVNASGINEVIYVRTFGQVWFTNNTFQNTPLYGYAIIYIVQTSNLVLDQLYFYNNVGPTTKRSTMLLTQLGPNANLSVTNVVSKDNTFNLASVIKIDKVSDQLSISNVKSTNDTMMSSNFYIKFEPAAHIELSTFKMEGGRYSDQRKQAAYFISIDKLNVDTKTPHLLQNISIIQSELGLLYIGLITDSPATQKVSTFDQLTYTNSTFSSAAEVITLSSFVTTPNIVLRFTNSYFGDLDFRKMGKVISFRNKMKNQMEFENVTFHNILRGSLEFNPFDTELPLQRVHFINSKFTQNNMEYGSFIQLMKLAQLTISDSIIEQNCNYEFGGFISQLDSSTMVKIQRCSISKNQAVSGGVISSKSGGVASIINSNITNNFAIKFGVYHGTLQSSFEIGGCRIEGNYAYSVPVIGLDGTLKSEISNCTIRDNVQLSGDQVKQEAKNCQRLCFLNPKLREFIQSNPDLLDSIQFKPIIKMNKGELDVTQNTHITSEQHLFSLTNSQFKVQDSKFDGMKVIGPIFDIIQTKFTLNNTTITGVSGNDPIIKAFLDCEVLVEGSFIHDVQIPVMEIQLSQSVMVSRSQIRDIDISAIIIKVTRTNFSFKNSKLKNLTSREADSPISIKESNQVQIQTTTLSQIDQTQIIVFRSNVSVIDSNFSNSHKGIHSTKSNLSIHNSSFTQLGHPQAIPARGGAILAVESSLVVKGSRLVNNSAVEGGAVMLESGTTMTNDKLEGNVFIQNSATVDGGAVKFTQYAPLLSLNSFQGNSAKYGQDFGSYTSKVTLKGMNRTSIKLTNIVSGQVNTDNLILELKDQNNQVVSIDSSSQIEITSLIKSTKVYGKRITGVKAGVGNFTGYVFEGTPGSKGVKFGIKSNAVNVAKLRVIDPTYREQTIEVDFRLCMKGEINTANKCEKCIPGTYSLIDNATDCFECLQKVTCAGGNELIIDQGYWRSHMLSTQIVQCLNPNACKGGFHPKNLYPVQCVGGYKSYLCSVCTPTNGDKYERLRAYTCSKCPNKAANTFRIIGFLLILLVALLVQIVVNLRKKEESAQSIVLKMLTNYLQVISASTSFNLSYPTYLTEIFAPFKVVGRTSDTILSFDCLISDYQLDPFAKSMAIFKTFLSFFLPIQLVLVFSLLWVALYFINKRFKDVKRNVVMSVTVIMFLLHPTLIVNTLSLFKCYEVQPGINRFEDDMSVQCWSSEHLKWAVGLGVPMFIIWVLGIPIVGLSVLFYYRKRLDQIEIKQYFLMLYQGVKTKHFYWEQVNSLRKGALLALNVFIPSSRAFWKSIAGVIVLIMFLRVQNYMKPYKKKLYNQLEYREGITSALTLYGGIIYIRNEAEFPAFRYILFVFIAITNIWFFVLWIYAFLLSLGEKYKFCETIANKMNGMLKFNMEDDDRSKVFEVEEDSNDLIDQEPPVPVNNNQIKNSSTKENKKDIKFQKKKFSSRHKRKNQLPPQLEEKEEAKSEVQNNQQAFVHPEVIHNKAVKTVGNLKVSDKWTLMRGKMSFVGNKPKSEIESESQKDDEMSSERMLRRNEVIQRVKQKMPMNNGKEKAQISQKKEDKRIMDCKIQ